MSDGDPPDADENPTRAGPERRIEPPRLKDLLGSADDTDVPEGSAGLPRLNWDAVTDTGGAPTDRGTPARPPAGGSSFQFDLGGALARLAGDGPVDDEATPSSRHAGPVPPSHQSVPPVAEPVSEDSPELFVTPPSPTRPPSPSMVTRPTLSLNFESVGREPSMPASVDHVPSGDTSDSPSHVDDDGSTPPHAYPRRVPGTHFESHMRPEPEAVPTIREATPADGGPRPGERSSLFDDLPTGSGHAAASNLPSAAPGLSRVAPGASPVFMPTLPPSNPAAPPSVAAPVSNVPATSDINALRAAQLRANKQQRQGKMFGRSLLAFVVIGGMIAGALVFGRSLLFGTQWDAQLTPIVNEIELERGSFDRPVSLETLPVPEFGQRLRMSTIGDAWIDRVPEWRALGLATGVVTTDSVDAVLAQTRTAVYDAETDTIYQRADVDEVAARADLRVALEQAFERQTGSAATVVSDAASVPENDPNALDDENLDIVSTPTVGFTGVSPLPVIATRAVDTATSTARATPRFSVGTETLPIPIAYELAAADWLGGPILLAAGVDPGTLPTDGPYPDVVLMALDDAPVLAPGGIVQPGDVAVAPTAALGVDDWSLVWSTRLPATTVAAMREQVVADSYSPLDRIGTACFVGVFRTTDEAANEALFAALGSWAASAPAASQAVVTPLDATGVQLEACDPGAEVDTAEVDTAEVDIAARPDPVATLIDLQRQRLTP